jgi:negative regulator of flagellin synthesis FlgM
MKIGQIEPKVGITPAPAERPAVPARSSTSAAPAEPSAKVELSAAATLLVGDSGAEFDAEKVQRISQAIRDGTFKPDADVIADRLIANAQELLSRSSR